MAPDSSPPPRGALRAPRGAISTPPPAPDAASDGATLVIPAYNESRGIQGVLRELVGHLAPLRERYPVEIIVVDDGSRDDTGDRAEELSAELGVRVIRHPQNRGYGAAIKTGVRHASYDWIVITDADGTYPAEQLEQMLGLRERYDMIVGARVGKNAKTPIVRRPAKFFLRMLAEYLSGARIPDLNSGFRVMRRPIIERFEGILPNKFSFTTTITLAMLSSNYRVMFLPIEYRHRIGKSKIRPIADTIGFTALVVRTVLFFNPLRVFVPAAVLCFIASGAVAVGSLVLTERLMDVTTVLLFVTGVQVLALGLLADLVNRKLS